MKFIGKPIYSIVSIACGLVMWQAMKQTCPTKETHLRAVTDVVGNIVDKTFEERIIVPEESKQLAEYLCTKVIPPAVNKLTQQRLDFRDFGLFSIGRIINEDGEAKPVSVGAFGKVMTFFDEKDSLDIELAKDVISGLDLENIIQNKQ